eukprot:gene6509-8089_t
MPPLRPAAAAPPAGVAAAVKRYDSVTGVGGGGGRSRVFMIYANGRAYPKYRVVYRRKGGAAAAGGWVPKAREKAAVFAKYGG